MRPGASLQEERGAVASYWVEVSELERQRQQVDTLMAKKRERDHKVKRMQVI